MSKTKHTPGPWRYGTASHEIYGAMGVQVAKIHIPALGAAIQTDWNANARLICAAPELYEVLRALVDSPNKKENALWDRARIALAKADRG